MGKCVICNEMVENERLMCPKHDARFRYQLLDRLRSDCEYYLGYGAHMERVLWAKDVKRHIKLMKEVYDSFPAEEKPEWLSYEKILEYENEMQRDGGQ